MLLSVLDLVLQEPGIEVGRRHTTIHIPRSTEHSKTSKIHKNTFLIILLLISALITTGAYYPVQKEQVLLTTDEDTYM